MNDSLYFLYPRLPTLIANQLAEGHTQKSVLQLADEWMKGHEKATFAPTGGNRASEETLVDLRTRIVNLACEIGYPEIQGQKQDRAFDISCAKLLHEHMHLHPSEASHNEIWSFLGCVLLPDIVCWRFEMTTDPARYVGKERGMRRHTFGRLWWRAYLGFDPGQNDPYWLFSYLAEDDFVQVTERSSIAVRPVLFRAFCAAFVHASEQNQALPRRDLMRDASKRLFRMLALVAVETLNDEEAAALAAMVFEQTARALSHQLQTQT